MPTQAEIERERYEARWKAQLDENSLRAAIEQAKIQGLEQGERIGVIHYCQRFLGQPETQREQLAALSLEELTQLAQDLQAQVMTRKSPNGKTGA